MSMGLFDFASAVAIGNLLTASVWWAITQFNKHDYNAPVSAYLAFFVPILFVLASVAITEGLPPQFDALTSR